MDVSFSGVMAMLELDSSTFAFETVTGQRWVGRALAKHTANQMLTLTLLVSPHFAAELLSPCLPLIPPSSAWVKLAENLNGADLCNICTGEPSPSSLSSTPQVQLADNSHVAGLCICTAEPSPAPPPPPPPLPPQVKLAENFNGADLRNICTEAGMFAIRDERDYTVHEDFMKAVRKLVEAKKLETTLNYDSSFGDGGKQ